MLFRSPDLTSVKGGSAWSERADIGVAVHRNKFVNINDGVKGAKEKWERDQYAPTLLDINKMKFEEDGREDTVQMWLDIRAGFRFSSRKPQWIANKEAALVEETTKENFDPGNEQQELPFTNTDNLPF